MAVADIGVPLLVRIGISGHRKPEDLGDVGRLRALIQEQLGHLKERLTARGTQLDLLLVSPLADGADRLLVDAVWEVEPEAQLIVPMPFDQDDYERSFLDHQSVLDFRAYLAHPNCLERFVVAGGSEGDFLPVGKYVVDGRSGEWTFWHPNGQKAALGSHYLDRRIGSWTFWSQDGTKDLTHSGTYKESR